MTINRIHVIMIGFALYLPVAAHAQQEEYFYRNRPLIIVVGTPAGEIYSNYARLISRFIPKHMPQLSSVVVQNMPGAGGLTAANYLYNIAPKDGSMIGTFSRAIPKQPLVDTRGVMFDATKFNWLGSPAQEVSVVFSWHTTPFKTIKDAQQHEMLVGAIGTGGDSLIVPFILNDLIGTKFKVITGYQGSAEYLLAIERGELQGSSITSWVGWLKSNRPDWISQRKINILLQLGSTSRKELQGVPLVFDLVNNEEGRQILDVTFATQSIAYPYAAPPGIPEDRLRRLRSAFDAVMNDPEFIADADKAGLEISPVSATEISQLITRIYSTSPEVLARLRNIVAKSRAALGAR